MSIINKISQEIRCCDGNHLYMLQTFCRIVPNGLFIECGVFRGGSAAILINESNQKVILCDTFKGLPERTKYDEDKAQLSKGRFGCDIEQVKTNIKNLDLDLGNTEFIQGKVEDTIPILKNRINKIALLHLDLDLYEGTKVCLKYLKPLIIKDGVIIFHDYPSLQGIKKIVDETFDNIIQLDRISACWINK